MGEVHIATHRMLARPAAIKLIRPEVLGTAAPGDAGRAIARFRREAETATTLRSPHTVELYDFGVTDDQTFYFVMLDFGLVTPVVAREGDLTLATGDGVLMGTPAYMAPEMATGGTIDARAAVYAVGCVAHYLLTGRQVFEGRTVMEVVAAHLHAVPVPPSHRTDAPVPQVLDRIVLSCLAKEAIGRPRSAAELSQLLEATGEAWSDEDAQAWWAEVGDRTEPRAPSLDPRPQMPSRDDDIETRPLTTRVDVGR